MTEPRAVRRSGPVSSAFPPFSVTLPFRALTRTAMADHGIADDQYEVLGEAGDCSVYRCEHGCLHLQIGDLNLRIEDDRFAELAEAVAAATQASPNLLRWVSAAGDGPAH